MDRDDIIDYAGIALSLMATAAKIWPELKGWLNDVTSGRGDALSMRVRDILSEQSESERVYRELGGR